jgi:3,4-dihydroxy 2-butanone 4-phosphate synthase / GTP cyclohydrolase II
MNLALFAGFFKSLKKIESNVWNQPKEIRPDEIVLNKIEEAIEDIKAGKVVIVVDDENRENEGDFVAAAETITPEIVNFYGYPWAWTDLRSYHPPAMRPAQPGSHGTSQYRFARNSLYYFCDLIGYGCTTGISASDRAKTIKALADKDIKPGELGRPGHIFPLRAREGGVLQRAGHTEAAIDLSRMAGLDPSGALVEIMNEDGSMARLPELMKIARKFNLKIISIEDLIAYRIKNESLISQEITVDLPTEWGILKLQRQTNHQRQNPPGPHQRCLG